MDTNCWANVPGPTELDIDAAHQAFGIPSHADFWSTLGTDDSICWDDNSTYETHFNLQLWK